MTKQLEIMQDQDSFHLFFLISVIIYASYLKQSRIKCGNTQYDRICID